MQMGCAPSAVRQMGSRDYDLLLRYAEEEPFGPWRDNFNSAVGFAALFNLQRGKNKERSPDDFMYKPPAVYAAQHRAGILEFFRANARRQQPDKPKGKSKRKKKRD